MLRPQAFQKPNRQYDFSEEDAKADQTAGRGFESAMENACS